MAYAGNKALIPLGDFGLFTDVPPGDVPRGALILARNVSFETGLITKAPGDLRYNFNALSAGIVALFDWWPDSVTQRLIAATSDGKIYRDIGDREFSLSVPIKTGLGTLTPKALFVEGGNETAGERKSYFSSPLPRRCKFSQAIPQLCLRSQVLQQIGFRLIIQL